MRICSRCKSKVNWAKDYCPLCAGSVIVVPDEQKTVSQTVPVESIESSVPGAAQPSEVSAPPKPEPAQRPAEPLKPIAELGELNEESLHQSIGLKQQSPIVSDPLKDPSIVQNEQKRIPVQGDQKNSSPSPQSEFLRQFPDASAGDSVFRKNQEQEKAPLPTPFTQQETAQEENNGIPFMEINSDEGKNPLKPIPHAPAAFHPAPLEDSGEEAPMPLVDFDAVKQPVVPQIEIAPQHPQTPQSEFLRQFPDASAGESVLQKKEEQEKTPAPMPFTQQETVSSDLHFSAQEEDNGIPFMEIHSDEGKSPLKPKSNTPSFGYDEEEDIPVLEINLNEGESYLKPISHQAKNTAPQEILPFEMEEEGIHVLEINTENTEKIPTASQKNADSDYRLEEAVLKPLEMIEVLPDENFDEGLAIQKTGEVHIPAHAHKPDETILGGLEPALEIIFEDDPDGDGYPGAFTPSNSGSPTPPPPPNPQQKAGQASGRKESMPSKTLTRGIVEISKSTPQKKKNEVPIINTRYIDIPRPRTRPSRPIPPEQKEQKQEESAPIEEIRLPIATALPEAAANLPIEPVAIQTEKPIEEKPQDETPLAMSSTQQEPMASAEPVAKLPIAPVRKPSIKRSVSLRQKNVSRSEISTPIMPKTEEKTDAAQTFLSAPAPQVLPFQKPGEKKRETEIRLAPPMTPLAKNPETENETENMYQENEARKLEYFPVSIHCLLQVFTLGIFPYLWFADRWKTFNRFSADEKINTATARSYIIFGVIAQVVAAMAIIFSLFIPEATLLSLSEKIPTGLGAWILGFFAPKTLWMLYGFILFAVVLPLRTLIYFSIRWNIRMVANEWDPEERMAPRTIGSWLGLFAGGTAYLQHHINRLIALGMLVTDYEDDEWDAFQDPISFIRSLAVDSDDTEDSIPTRGR